MKQSTKIVVVLSLLSLREPLRVGNVQTIVWPQTRAAGGQRFFIAFAFKREKNISYKSSCFESEHLGL